MPRRKQPPRLFLRQARKGTGRKLRANAVWIILDGGKHIATGCLQGEDRAAQEALSRYISEKYSPLRKERDIEVIDIAGVLSIYDDDTRTRQANQPKLDERLRRLNEFWGGRMLSEVNGESCREYARLRGSSGGARRDLEDLRAAINHHASEGLHRGNVRVVLPPKGAPRERWLTREEVAQLLWACWRCRENQTRHRGLNDGIRLPTHKRPLVHLARFILIGIYTGTRAAAIASASPVEGQGRSYINLSSGIYHRLAQGKLATNKRQPPVPLPPRLLAHLRRWVRKGLIDQHFVEFNGKPVKSVKTAFQSAVRLAKLEGPVSPHTLRHTAATWLMQIGVKTWDAAGFLGMSEKTLRDVYGHHHPEYLRAAATAIGSRKPISLVKSLVREKSTRSRATQVTKLTGGGRSLSEPGSAPNSLLSAEIQRNFRIYQA